VPADLSDELARRVFDVATAAIAAMGDAVSAFHTEIKLTPDGPQVIEVNGRLCGGALPDVLGLACGVSAHRLACLTALGQDVHIIEPLACDRVGYKWTFQHPVAARRLTNVQNLDQARQLPGVQEIRLGRQVGDELDWRFGTQGGIFTVVGSADSHTAVAGENSIAAAVCAMVSKYLWRMVGRYCRRTPRYSAWGCRSRQYTVTW